MVEFAIAGGLFALLMIGIVEFGLAAWAKSSVAADAREGARYAIVHGSQSGRIADEAMVAAYVKSKTSLDQTIIVTTTWQDAAKTPGSQVSVKVKHAVPRRGPFLPAHTDSSTSTMRIVF